MHTDISAHRSHSLQWTGTRRCNTCSSTHSNTILHHSHCL
jgi:hypothetical protein